MQRGDEATSCRVMWTMVEASAFILSEVGALEDLEQVSGINFHFNSITLMSG